MIQKSKSGDCYFLGKKITEDKYDQILEIIKNKPKRPGYDYRLREDLTWEEYHIDPPDPDPEIEDAEVYDILFGGAECSEVMLSN